MTVRPQARGVGALARLLAAAAEGRPLTAAAFAREAGIARSTGFSIARRAEEKGFVQRRADGTLAAGERLVTLAYAAYGLGLLHGPAEAICTLLRDGTGWAASLSGPEPERACLFHLPGQGAGGARLPIEAPLRGPDGCVRGWVVLHAPVEGHGKEALAAAERQLLAAADALQAFLQPPPSSRKAPS